MKASSTNKNSVRVKTYVDDVLVGILTMSGNRYEVWKEMFLSAAASNPLFQFTITEKGDFHYRGGVVKKAYTPSAAIKKYQDKALLNSIFGSTKSPYADEDDDFD